MEDAEKIHKGDADRRERERILAEEERKEVEVEAEIATMRREQRLIKERKKHDRFLKKQSGGEPGDIDLDDLTEDQQQFVKDLKMETQGPRCLEITEAIIKDIVAERGGKLTKEDEAYIKLLRETAKKLIADQVY